MPAGGLVSDASPTLSLDVHHGYAVLLVEGEAARRHLCHWARARMGPDECLVAAPSFVGKRRAFVMDVTSSRAALVARSPPRLVRGRLMQETSYYRVPLAERDAVEAHLQDGIVTHTRDVRLAPIERGHGVDGDLVPA